MSDLIGLYPTWYVPQIGTAWVMGIIGTIHVLASNTSVGAAVLFALLESRAVRENTPSPAPAMTCSSREPVKPCSIRTQGAT